MARMNGPCPNCKGRTTVINVFTAPWCGNCATGWSDYRSWRADVRNMGMKPGEGNEVTDEYISSGQMKEELEAVIETAVLEARFLMAKDLGAKAAKIVTNGLSDGTAHDILVNDLLQLMVDELKKTMRDVGKEPAGE